MDEEIRYAVVSLGSFLAGERAEIRGCGASPPSPPCFELPSIALLRYAGWVVSSDDRTELVKHLPKTLSLSALSQQKLFAAVERDAQLVDPGVDMFDQSAQHDVVRPPRLLHVSSSPQSLFCGTRAG
jgi:hypothetical protein